MSKIPSHVRLTLVGAKWCGAGRPAFNQLVAAGWPVEYWDIEETPLLPIPPSLPQLIIDDPKTRVSIVGPDVRAMKDTLKGLFGDGQ